MPIEQIKRMQSESQAREALVRQQELERQNRQQIEAQQCHLEYEQAHIEREKFNRARAEQIFRESGALDGLKRIENELLAGHVRKHNIVFDPSGLEITLVWGNRYSISDNYPCIGYESIGLLFTHQVRDYSSIRIQADIDKNALTIFGAEGIRLSHDAWQYQDKVNEVLAQAYINPGRLNDEYHEPSPPAYSNVLSH